MRQLEAADNKADWSKRVCQVEVSKDRLSSLGRQATHVTKVATSATREGSRLTRRIATFVKIGHQIYNVPDIDYAVQVDISSFHGTGRIAIPVKEGD